MLLDKRVLAYFQNFISRYKCKTYCLFGSLLYYLCLLVYLSLSLVIPYVLAEPPMCSRNAVEISKNLSLPLVYIMRGTSEQNSRGIMRGTSE